MVKFLIYTVFVRGGKNSIPYVPYGHHRMLYMYWKCDCADIIWNTYKVHTIHAKAEHSQYAKYLFSNHHTGFEI